MIDEDRFEALEITMNDDKITLNYLNIKTGEEIISEYNGSGNVCKDYDHYEACLDSFFGISGDPDPLYNQFINGNPFKEEYENLEIPRHVTITPLGSFYPKGITMPANPHHARQICLLAEPLPKDGTAKNFPSRLMDVIFERKHDRSCQPTVTLGDSRRHRLHCRCSSTWPEDFRVSSF